MGCPHGRRLRSGVRAADGWPGSGVVVQEVDSEDVTGLDLRDAADGDALAAATSRWVSPLALADPRQVVLLRLLLVVPSAGPAPARLTFDQRGSMWAQPLRLVSPVPRVTHLSAGVASSGNTWVSSSNG